MRLSVSLAKGLEIIVPHTMSEHEKARFIPEFLQKKEQWIRNAINRLQQKTSNKNRIDQCDFPKTIKLLALDQTFTVEYLIKSVSQQDSKLPLTLKRLSEYQLSISYDNKKTENKIKIFALLEQFFKDYAAYYLQKRLKQLSQLSNLSYNCLTIRSQKTRWGSCSAKKNISLNYRLLFVEKDLLDYVLYHELTHTLEMNHSQSFWNALDTLIPDARERDQRINQASTQLPCWIHYKQLSTHSI
ncbi:MAG: M48 family metallopeptidase [Gammaproteobacteria bacterium]|nr:M48 family metallopeptidase [Gammaproteobacteria bacterium]